MCIIKLVYDDPNLEPVCGRCVVDYSNVFGAPLVTPIEQKAKQFRDNASAERWARTYIQPYRYEIVQI